MVTATLTSKRIVVITLEADEFTKEKDVNYLEELINEAVTKNNRDAVYELTVALETYLGK